MLCKTCLGDKPLLEFRRRATLIQSRAWLRNPNLTVPIRYTGKDCNACHAKHRRKPSDLSPSALRKRLVTERKLPLFAVDEAERLRRVAGKKRQQEGAIKGLKGQRYADFAPILASLAKETNRMKYRRSRPDVTPDAANLQDTLLAEASFMKNTLWSLRKKGGAVPAYCREVLTGVKTWRDVLALAHVEPNTLGHPVPKKTEKENDDE